MQTLVGQRWCFPDIALYLNTCEEQRDELVQRLGPAGFSLRGVKCAGLPGACAGMVGAEELLRRGSGRVGVRRSVHL